MERAVKGERGPSQADRGHKGRAIVAVVVIEISEGPEFLKAPRRDDD